ncbi:MAG TPA: MarR family transcriptional regulator [Firmicutes bacterium]|nr:MarR family transcriptional regulator [Bacillota bacterium]
MPQDGELLLTTAKLFCGALTVAVTGPVLEEIARLALTETQFAALRYILLHDMPAPTELADGLGISSAAVTRLADRLERKGLLIRQPDPEDRRTLRLVLTEEGRRIVEQVIEGEQARFDDVIKRLPPSLRDAFETGIKAFLDACLTSPDEIERICLRCGWVHNPGCPGSIAYQRLTGKPMERY